MKNQSDCHYGRVLASHGGVEVVACETCGYAHIFPLPEEGNREDFYRNDFYKTFSEDYIRKHEEDKAWWSIEHNEKYERFEKYLASRNQIKTILDIGSGPGFFLKAGSDRGWEVQGIEPGEIAWLHSVEVLGLKVHHAYFKKSNAKSFGTFDVVHLNNVLEHVVNASEVIALSHGIINKNGIISVTVPNDFSPLQDIVANHLGKGPWWVVPQQHTNYFDLSSLKRLLESNGFVTIYYTASFPMELFLLMGDDYVGNDQLGRKMHAKRKQFEIAMDASGKTALKRKLYDTLAELDLGRQITVMARKIS